MRNIVGKYNRTMAASISNTQLIAELEQLVNECIATVSGFREMDAQTLEKRPNSNPTAWNALECLEHLNRYGEFYLPEVKRVLASKRPVAHPGSQQFKFSWWGNYFLDAVAPKPVDRMNTMNTFKRMNPTGDRVQLEVIDTFLEHQQQWLQLLKKAAAYDLAGVRTRTTIRFVHLRLGDTLRVVINHNKRHVNQALRAMGASA